MTHDELKAKALSRPEVNAEYDALEDEFALLRQLLVARQRAELEQGLSATLAWQEIKGSEGKAGSLYDTTTTPSTRIMGR